MPTLDKICPSLTASAGNIPTPCNRNDCGDECRGPRIEGIGHEVISVAPSELRRLASLPRDVQIIGIVSDPRNHPPRVALIPSAPPDWYPVPYQPGQEPKDQEPLVFVHISHRFCIRVYPGQPMSYSTLEDFLDRYNELTRQGR